MILTTAQDLASHLLGLPGNLEQDVSIFTRDSSLSVATRDVDVGPSSMLSTITDSTFFPDALPPDGSSNLPGRSTAPATEPTVRTAFVGPYRVKRFQCSICGKEFMDRSTYKHHYMTHTGERPHQCSFCPYRSIQSGSLYRHIRIKHKGVLQWSVSFLSVWHFSVIRWILLKSLREMS